MKKLSLLLFILISCTDETSEDMRLFNSLLNNENPGLSTYVYPGFWTGTEIEVQYDDNNIFYSYDVADNASELLGLIKYYVSTTGNDGNDGLTQGSAVATIQGAINKGAKNIVILAGDYDGADFVRDYYQDIAITGLGQVKYTKAANGYFSIIPRNAPRVLYFENIEFSANLDYIGTGTFNNLGSVGYLKNIRCTTPTSIDGTANRNGISTNSIPLILQNCISSNANRDNFNYHNTWAVSNFECIEIGCVSENPSYNDINTNNQCSTAHEGMNMLRIGGSYLNGVTQVVADTNLGAKSVLIGCEISQQKAINGGGTTILSTGDGEAFKCNLIGLGTPLYLRAEAPGTLTIKDTNTEHTNITGNVIIL